jgi:hypothetical protein
MKMDTEFSSKTLVRLVQEMLRDYADGVGEHEALNLADGKVVVGFLVQLSIDLR